jgi:hypothetical protein
MTMGRAPMLLCALLAGCASERTLLVVLDSDLGVPAELDTVTVDVSASRTEEGDLCMPASRVFELENESELPLRIEIVIGQVFAEWVVVRAEGRLGAAPVVRIQRVNGVPESGVHELALTLERACAGRACALGEQCIEGSCVADPFAGILDDPARFAGEASCAE